ncbi:MAG: DNA-binding protein [Bacteroidetes bacterium]|nr:DNA-binding protein [Bacteroidota bacterium]
MKAKVIIERGSDGLFSYYMNEDTFDFGLNGQGNTIEEAKKEFLSVYSELKDMYLKENKEFPKLEFEYEYDMSSFLNYYSGILSKSGLEKITGVNQKQLWHYSSGRKKPARTTIKKIQIGLHNFSKELGQVQFV